MTTFLSAAWPRFGSECGASGHTSPMQSGTDASGHADSVGQDYGGGCATRRGMERATETKQGWVGCTQRANPILSIAAIVASNPGDFGQGRVGARYTGASRSLTSSCLSSSPFSCALSSCRSLSSEESFEPFQCLRLSKRKQVGPQCARAWAREPCLQLHICSMPRRSNQVSLPLAALKANSSGTLFPIVFPMSSS